MALGVFPYHLHCLDFSVLGLASGGAGESGTNYIGTEDLGYPSAFPSGEWSN